MARRRTETQKREPRRSLVRRLTRGPMLLTFAVAGAVAAVAAIIVVSLATQGGGGIERLEGINAEGRIRGSADAPVTIIELADFQCSHCARFAQTTGNRIEEEYVATKLVRTEFRYMPILGAESFLAAEAAECANDQEKFWEYHDKLFEKQSGVNSGAFSRERLERFAGELDLDQEAFDTCLGERQKEQLVADEADAGAEAGVTSTPWFFINGEEVRGAKPFNEFEEVIERKLEEAAATP